MGAAQPDEHDRKEREHQAQAMAAEWHEERAPSRNHDGDDGRWALADLPTEARPEAVPGRDPLTRSKQAIERVEVEAEDCTRD